MMSEKTLKFIEKALSVHNDKYDYKDTVYINSITKVSIKCKKHGAFKQLPSNHLKGQGCSICGYSERTNKTKLSQEDFLSRIIKIHKDKLNFSKVNYINIRTYVDVICKIHGEFRQRPDSLLAGIGCAKCSNFIKTKNAIDSRRVSKEEFLRRVETIHKDTYDYKLVEFSKISDKIKVLCRKHGEFKVSVANHLKGSGCPTCGNIKISEKLKIGKEKILDRFIAIHGDSYDYSKINTNGITEKVTITCKVHGDFQQVAYIHACGFGCPKCSCSKGELLLIKLLKKNNIDFIHQYRLPNTKYRYRYDFYLPKYNTLIEFQGEQHFIAVDFFGGEEGLERTKFRDAFKRDLAIFSNMNLLYFTYKHLRLTEEDFENVLLRSIHKYIHH